MSIIVELHLYAKVYSLIIAMYDIVLLSIDPIDAPINVSLILLTISFLL